MQAPESPITFHRSHPSSTASGEHARPLRGRSHIDENTPVATLTVEVLKLSIPLGLAAVAQNSISVVLVAMVGKMVGDRELGATVLANSLLNATAYSLSAGLCGALETVLSQSYGRDQTSKLYGVHVQRMSLILLIVAAFVGPVLAFSDSLLISIRQNAEVAHFTGEFCRISLFGVYSLMLLEVMRRYFACQHLNTQLSVNLIIGAGSFPFVLWACIKMLSFPGAAVAWSLLMSCMPASLFLYLLVTGKYKKTWGGWEPTALMNWGPLLKLAFPSMAMMLSEWMSQEVNLIVAGYAPINELDAFSILHQFSTILWSMASGVFIEAAVLVGNALGERKPLFARRCALVCLGLTFLFALVNLSVTLLLQNWIPTLFTNNVAVHALFRKMLRFYVVYHLLDSFQSCMMGVLRGCGLQLLGAMSIALVYSVVGVPLGIIVFFTTSMGVEALWLGPCLGLSVVGCPLYGYLLTHYIDWESLQLHADDGPSFNASMNEHSRGAFTSTPSLSVTRSDLDMVRSEDEELRSEGGTVRLCRGSHHGTPGLGSLSETGRHTPNSAGPLSFAHDNTSFTSFNACLSQRRVRSVPSLNAIVPNRSDARQLPLLTESLSEVYGAAAAPESHPNVSPSDCRAAPLPNRAGRSSRSALRGATGSRSPSAQPNSVSSDEAPLHRPSTLLRSATQALPASTSALPRDRQRRTLPWS
ncbi:conserved hypothetical protein [Leishmania infantum JPCM5]|uniref:Membrane_transporter_protein_-_putative n=2 Tax=Leishmania infantum TaxID=5671 RepID=A0A6L0XS74_LEIIN|nr:conserved hypothetical protein [Leishmania infantum JPCM5]CAC9546068.1 membrane_transporter_protein_-_putative [Leishmania infantum]CBZ09021.1 conserved hypothetical protein [Leishmania infantum JPCM5]SUZ46187.1 membrane_transporter_protein_-_putative [Leishmania infantum]|eukprot:XP_003392818.1 conserved hypothetical protein [Leishmania infantum JPCM5]